MNENDLREFLVTFQDHLAPKLDVYEQAIYLYIFRNSRLIGRDEAVIALKSERNRMAVGIGMDGSPMSESTAVKKIQSLQKKGCLDILRTTHTGRLFKMRFPSEIPGCIPISIGDAPVDIESMDFFTDERNRLLLLERENNICFYTLKVLSKDNFVVDHVISRPLGSNSYWNCVAASREANNRKGAMQADDFFRKLFREGLLSESELRERIEQLNKLTSGELKPPVPGLIV